jgi:hypothetical protein
MPTLVRILAGILLIAHGGVHTLYLVPNPDDPKYPFSIESSWMLPEPSRRPVALTLIVATMVAFLLLTLAVWGVSGLAGAWPAIAIVASSLSLLLLVAFWDNRLAFGVVIDLALIALAVIQPSWTDSIA